MTLSPATFFWKFPVRWKVGREVTPQEERDRGLINSTTGIAFTVVWSCFKTGSVYILPILPRCPIYLDPCTGLSGSWRVEEPGSQAPCWESQDCNSQGSALSPPTQGTLRHPSSTGSSTTSDLGSHATRLLKKTTCLIPTCHTSFQRMADVWAFLLQRRGN